MALELQQHHATRSPPATASLIIDNLIENPLPHLSANNPVKWSDGHMSLSFYLIMKSQTEREKEESDFRE